MQPSPARHRLALALALAGVALSVFTLTVHQRLATDVGYTSFCNLGGVVNCDAVLGSRWGRLLGLPVAAWGLAAFVMGALLSLPGTLGRPRPGLADLLLLAIVSASFGFALVLLVIAGGVIGRACLLCLALDVVIAAWLVVVLPIARRFETSPADWWRGRPAARLFLASGAALAVVGGSWAAVSSPALPDPSQDVRLRDPRFHAWYSERPVRSTRTLSDGAVHRKGPADAPVAIVEFSDFQCPYCVRAAKDLSDLVRTSGDVSLIFRHFPLDRRCNRHLERSMHPDACLAASAAECASDQHRFWEFHDALFDQAENLGRERLLALAREMELDTERFAACLDDPATLARVEEDVAVASRHGVTATPTLFINGRFVEGTLGREHFEQAVAIERYLLAHGHDHAG